MLNLEESLVYRARKAGGCHRITVKLSFFLSHPALASGAAQGNFKWPVSQIQKIVLVVQSLSWLIYYAS